MATLPLCAAAAAALRRRWWAVSSSFARSHADPAIRWASASASGGEDDEDDSASKTTEGAPTISNVGRSDQGSTSPRFYKTVSVRQRKASRRGKPAKFEILLDTRQLKTPMRNPLFLPTEALARAIGFEWAYQEQRMRTFTMPLMQMAATAVDRTHLDRKAHMRSIHFHLDADPAILFLHENIPSDELTPLQRAQRTAFEPIVLWFERRFGVKILRSSGLLPDPQPEEVHKAVDARLDALDNWEFTAVNLLVASSKSCLLAMALDANATGSTGTPGDGGGEEESEGEGKGEEVGGRAPLDVRQAIELSRTEEEHQIGEWGMIEGGHDIDRADTNVRIASPVSFLRLYRY